MKYPKAVISQGAIERVYYMLSAKEINGFVLAVARFNMFYAILAFPMGEGIGGRSVHQWDAAHLLIYYEDHGNEEVANVYNSDALRELKKKISINIAPTPMDPQW